MSEAMEQSSWQTEKIDGFIGQITESLGRTRLLRDGPEKWARMVQVRKCIEQLMLDVREDFTDIRFADILVDMAASALEGSSLRVECSKDALEIIRACQKKDSVRRYAAVEGKRRLLPFVPPESCEDLAHEILKDIEGAYLNPSYIDMAIETIRALPQDKWPAFISRLRWIIEDHTDQSIEDAQENEERMHSACYDGMRSLTLLIALNTGEARHDFVYNTLLDTLKTRLVCREIDLKRAAYCIGQTLIFLDPEEKPEFLEASLMMFDRLALTSEYMNDKIPKETLQNHREFHATLLRLVNRMDEGVRLPILCSLAERVRPDTQAVFLARFLQNAFSHAVRTPTGLATLQRSDGVAVSNPFLRILNTQEERCVLFKKTRTPDGRALLVVPDSIRGALGRASVGFLEGRKDHFERRLSLLRQQYQTWISAGPAKEDQRRRAENIDLPMASFLAAHTPT